MKTFKNTTLDDVITFFIKFSALLIFIFSISYAVGFHTRLFESFSNWLLGNNSHVDNAWIIAIFSIGVSAITRVSNSSQGLLKEFLIDLFFVTCFVISVKLTNYPMFNDMILLVLLCSILIYYLINRFSSKRYHRMCQYIWMSSTETKTILDFIYTILFPLAFGLIFYNMLNST